MFVLCAEWGGCCIQEDGLLHTDEQEGRPLIGVEQGRRFSQSWSEQVFIGAQSSGHEHLWGGAIVDIFCTDHHHSDGKKA